MVTIAPTTLTALMRTVCHALDAFLLEESGESGPGSITGTWNPYDTHLEYPFEVVAKSFSTLLNIPRVALVDTLTEFPSDRPSMLALLENEYMMTMKSFSRSL